MSMIRHRKIDEEITKSDGFSMMEYEKNGK